MAMFIFYILPMAPIKPLCQNYVAGNGTLRLSESKILVFTIWDSPGGPVVKTPWIQSLIRKLRSNMPCSLAKKINKFKKIKYLLSGSLQKKLANPWFQFSSVQSLSHVRLLRPYESQHDRPPCPSPTPGVYPTHVHWVGDVIYPSHPLSSPSPPALNLSQHQGLLKWVSTSHQVDKVLEFQLQHQSFQWTPRTNLLQNGLVGSPCSPRDP